MKKLILILLLASCSDKPNVESIVFRDIQITGETTNFGVILSSEDNTILSIKTDSLGNYDYSSLIVTDSLAAIKMFLEMQETRNKEIMEKWKLTPVYKEDVIEL